MSRPARTECSKGHSYKLHGTKLATGGHRCRLCANEAGRAQRAEAAARRPKRHVVKPIKWIVAITPAQMEECRRELAERDAREAQRRKGGRPPRAAQGGAACPI